MTYDPAEPIVRDQIRGMVRDTSNDVATEYFPDATYDAVIARHARWQHAAAELARRVAGKIEDKPVSLTAVGDASIAWSSNRAKSLYAMADRLDREADLEDEAAAYGGVVAVTSDVMTPIDTSEVW